MVWQEHRSPKAVVNFNAVLGQVAERSVAYAVCYLESDRARDGLWLQVGSDDQAKVYLNGREIYRVRQPRSLETLDTVGPVALERGVNVLLFKVVNETGSGKAVCGWWTTRAGRPGPPREAVAVIGAVLSRMDTAGTRRTPGLLGDHLPNQVVR